MNVMGGAVGTPTGDAPARREFEALVAAQWKPMLRAAWLLTGGWAAAEDLAQATLLQAWSSWPRVRSAEELAAYLRRMQTNEYLGQQRRRMATETPRDALPETRSADLTAETDRRVVLLSALDELPPMQRAAIVLRYFDDLSIEQTAAALGCSLGNAKSQTSRALAKLRRSPRLEGFVQEMS